MARIIAIQLAHPEFPRSVYLAQDLATVERFLENAFILKGVRWDMLKQLHDVERFPQLNTEVQTSPVTWSTFFQEIYPYTLIPFTTVPTPNGNKIQVNDLGRLPRVKQVYNKLFGAPEEPQFLLPHHPASLLMEVIKSAKLKVGGELYDSPCFACSRYFDHIAGTCDLVGTTGHEVSLCHMSILHRSEVTTRPQEGVHPAQRPLDAVD